MLNIVLDWYGSRRGLYEHVRARLLQLGRHLPRHRELDWDRARGVVATCKVNVCRYATAEARARSLGFDTVVARIDCSAGCGSDSRMIAEAVRFRVDLNGHRTTRIDQLRLARTDHLIPKEPQHLTVESKLGAGLMSLLRLWLTPCGPSIHDTYNSGPPHFHGYAASIRAESDHIAADARQGTFWPHSLQESSPPSRPHRFEARSHRRLGPPSESRRLRNNDIKPFVFEFSRD